MKANARGVNQLTLSEGEYCVGCDKITPDKKYMFYITSSGRAKLTDMKYFPTMKRKNETLSLIKLESKDTLVGIKGVVKSDDVIIYKKNSKPEVIHISDLPVSTRIAKAEKYVKTPKGDKVVAYTIVNN
jgi:DNA gyrase/topoisomerase IV subunit A